jgi:hypothetical protein
MAVVRITFDPATLKPEDEAWPAFQAGGMALKVWALYKRTYLTSQHFRVALEQLAAYFEEAFDPEKPEIKPYTNIDEFADLLGRCGFRAGLSVGSSLRSWIVKNWDYFNLSIQRELVLEYQIVEPVTKRMVVALAGKGGE